MYHVIVKKFIARNRDCDDGKTYWYYLAIPFAPMEGMTLSTSGWNCSQIETINWTQNELSGQRYFTCHVGNEVPYHSDGYDYDFEYLCKSAEEGFWKPFDKEAQARINEVTAKAI